MSSLCIEYKMAKQTTYVKMAELSGGGGAAEYMQQVAGDMNAQVAGPNGSLQYSRVSGGGLEQMAVPALLVLANNVAPKYLRRNASTLKRGGRRKRGGGDNEVKVDDVITTPVVAVVEKPAPTLSEIGKQNGMMGLLGLNTEEGKPAPMLNEIGKSNGIANINVDVSDSKLEGGNMLQQIAVPATLMVANQMFGKRSSKKSYKSSGGKKSKKSKRKGKKGGKGSRKH